VIVGVAASSESILRRELLPERVEVAEREFDPRSLDFDVLQGGELSFDFGEPRLLPPQLVAELPKTVLDHATGGARHLGRGLHELSSLCGEGRNCSRQRPALLRQIATRVCDTLPDSCGDVVGEPSAPGRGADAVDHEVLEADSEDEVRQPHHAPGQVDSEGLPTDVPQSGEERWLSVFLRFARNPWDPRTDGNSQQVMFREDESFQIVVRQAPPAPLGSAQRVPLVDDELLVCDVHRLPGQTQITTADIDVARRQSFVFATGNAISVIAGLWKVIVPAAGTVQASLDAIDAWLTAHLGGAAAHRHNAKDVDYTPHGFVASSTVQAAVDELVDDLSSTAAASLSNRSLLQKADLALADLTAGGGILLPAQAKKFIRLLINQSVLMGMATVVPDPHAALARKRARADRASGLPGPHPRRRDPRVA
jgi:hypothetical protein